MKFEIGGKIHIPVFNIKTLYAQPLHGTKRIFAYLKTLPTRYLRRLSNEFFMAIPILVIVVIFINYIRPKSTFEILKENVMINSHDNNSHLYLAREFINTNQIDFAANELSQISPTEKLNNQELIALKNEPSLVQSELIKWKKLTTQNPNFRDGHIKLAILNWKLYRNFDTQKELSSAQKIDPNNTFLKKIQKTLRY